LKKLSNQLQPFSKVVQVIKKIIVVPKSISKIRIQHHVFSYALHQFGFRIEGTAYRERENGERISNFDVEMTNLIPLHRSFTEIHIGDRSLNTVHYDNLILAHHESILDILRPWSISLDSGDDLDRDQKNLVLQLSANAERNISDAQRDRNQFVLAEDHLDRAYSYARRYEGEGEEKTSMLLNILNGRSALRSIQGDLAGAVNFAEEGYHCAFIAYNPVHSEVQKAADLLIQSLSRANNLDKAEMIAQLTLENLRDSANNVDQESEKVANGYLNLGRTVYELNVDQPKAEMLVRESLRIRLKVYDNNHLLVGHSLSLLVRILLAQGKIEEETERLLERNLANAVRNEGIYICV
jgi:hypothetical protein